MKLRVDNEYNLFIPENKITVVDYHKFKEIFINRMKLFDDGKKSCNCMLYTEDSEIINHNEIKFEFLNKQKLDEELNFEKKKLLRSYLESCIVENDKMFLSLYNAIEVLHGIYSDQGFLKILSLLEEGLDAPLEITNENMNIDTFLNALKIITFGISDYNKLIIYLNITNIIYRDEFKIIYIDNIFINENILQCMIKFGDNFAYLIDVNCISNAKNFETYDFSILSQSTDKDLYSITKDSYYKSKYLYAHIDYVKKNFDFQSKKIKEIICEIESISDNYSLNFDTPHPN